MAEENDNKGTADDGNKGAEEKDTGRAGGESRVLEDLASERKARQAAEKALKEREDKLAEFEQANQSEHEKALEKARKEAREQAEKEVTSKANARILRTEVRRLAAEKFADPADPVAALDLSNFTVDDDGNVDEKAIKKELDDLLKRKPHWGKEPGERRRQGSADQGARGTGKSGGSNMNDLIRNARNR